MAFAKALFLTMVNSLYSWLKRYLWRFMGIDPKNLQSYLSWFVYLLWVHQAKEKRPKTERVVRHLLKSDSNTAVHGPESIIQNIDCQIVNIPYLSYDADLASRHRIYLERLPSWDL